MSYYCLLAQLLHLQDLHEQLPGVEHEVQLSPQLRVDRGQTAELASETVGAVPWNSRACTSTASLVLGRTSGTLARVARTSLGVGSAAVVTVGIAAGGVDTRDVRVGVGRTASRRRDSLASHRGNYQSRLSRKVGGGGSFRMRDSFEMRILE